MNDLKTAREHLPDHSLVLCRDGVMIVSDKRGVLPMVGFIREGRELSGYVAADRVVGRAAAMHFVHAGIRDVYAETVSDGAVAFLTAHGIPVRYGTKTEGIVNREGTGPCPMETAVADIEDAEEGVHRIIDKVSRHR